MEKPRCEYAKCNKPVAYEVKRLWDGTTFHVCEAHKLKPYEETTAAQLGLPNSYDQRPISA